MQIFLAKSLLDKKLKQLNSGYFVQIASLNPQKVESDLLLTFAQLAQKLITEHRDQKVYKYLNTKARIILLAGPFTTAEDARNFIQNLPRSIVAGKPYIRSVKRLKESLHLVEEN